MIIDAHLHFLTEDPQAVLLPEELDVKFLNVCVHRPGWVAGQRDVYQRLAEANPSRFAWVTTFDLPGFGDAAYHERVLAHLDADFAVRAGGAVGCKIWKDVGMELKGSDGQYILPDDPIFDPIYAHLAKRGWTLLAHIAEPLACWRELDPASPHYGYYKEHPQWHMHGRRDVPSHEQLMAARDHVLQRHPTLRVVGAHLGSMEYSLEAMAERLDRYPNFAIDTSARLGDLACLPREKLIAFIERYQDRILFGTDVGLWGSGALAYIRLNLCVERAFYESDGPVKIGSRMAQGLALPDAVLEKLYRANARAWYPGL